MRRYMDLQKKLLAFLLIFIMVFTLFPKLDTVYSAGVIRVVYERNREDTLSGTIEKNRLIIYGNGFKTSIVKGGRYSEIPLPINVNASNAYMLVVDDADALDQIEGLVNNIKVFNDDGDTDITSTAIPMDLSKIPTITSVSKSKVYVGDPLSITGLYFNGLITGKDKVVVSGTEYDLSSGDSDPSTGDISGSTITIGAVKSPVKTTVSDITIRKDLGSNNEIVTTLKNSIRVVNRIDHIVIDHLDPNAGPRNKVNKVNIYGTPGNCNFSGNLKVFVNGVQGTNDGTIQDNSGNVVGLSVELPTSEKAGIADILLVTADDSGEFLIEGQFVYLDIGNTLTIDDNGISPDHKKETEQQVKVTIKGRNIGYFNGVGYDKLSGVDDTNPDIVGYGTFDHYDRFSDPTSFKVVYSGKYGTSNVSIVRQVKVFIDGEAPVVYDSSDPANQYNPSFSLSKDTITVIPNDVNLNPKQPKPVDVSIKTTTTVVEAVYGNDNDPVIYNRSEEYSVTDGFTYMPDEIFPTITAVTPEYGANDAATSIYMTITGDNFEVADVNGVTKLPEVYVGSRKCTDIRVYDDINRVVDGKIVPVGKKIKCVLPGANDNIQGASDVVVINPSGGQATKVNAYTYKVVPPERTGKMPTIKELKDPFADIKGGVITKETVLITGDNFDTSSSAQPRIMVTIDGEKATVFGKVSSDGKTVTVIPPPGTVPGPTKLQLINEDGSVATADFTYKRITTAPKITKIVPVKGGKGTKLVIIGEDFVLPDDTVKNDDPKKKGTVVLFNGMELNAYNYDDYGNTTDIIPGSKDPSDPADTGTIGTNGIYYEGNFNSSPLDGEMVKVQNITTIYVDVPDKFYSFSATSPNHLKAVDIPLGDLQVAVLNPDGAKSKDNVTFTYLKPLSSPTILPRRSEGMTPSEGTIEGGTVVTIKGSGFKRDGLEVYFATEKSAKIDFVSTTELKVLVPSYPYTVPNGTDRITVPVMIMNYDGGVAVRDGAQGTENEGFTYRVPGSHPKITSLSPNTGTSAGGDSVIIRGTDFRRDSNGNPKVYFNGKEAQVDWYGDDNVTETLIVKTPPSDIEGPVDVTLLNYDAGTCVFKSFTYSKSKPTITKVTPKIIKKTGNAHLQINGTNFLENDFSSLVSLPGSDYERVDRNTDTPKNAADEIKIKAIFGDSSTADVKSIDTIVGPPTAVMDDLVFTYSRVDADTGNIKISKASDPNTVLDRRLVDGGSAGTMDLDMPVNSAHLFIVNGEMDLDNVGQGDEGILVEMYPDQVIITRRLAAHAKVENEGTQVTVQTPPINSIGSRKFYVENGDGGIASATVTVTNPTSNPEITDISPKNKMKQNDIVRDYDPTTADIQETYTYTPLDGGAFITITGKDFDKDCKVYMGDKELEITNRSSNYNQLTVKVPKGTEADLNQLLKIMIMNSDNTTDSSVMPIPHYIVYQKPQSNPAIDNVTPAKTSSRGQNIITITGTGFMDGIKVYLDGIQVGSNPSDPLTGEVTWKDRMTVLVKMPYGIAPGKKQVRVENPDFGNFTKKDAFTVISSPTINMAYKIKGDVEKQLDPVLFSVEGGENIKITGSEFAKGARVIIGGTLKPKSELGQGETGTECQYIDDMTMVIVGGTDAAGINVVDENTITFTTPKLNVGKTTIIVLNADGGVTAEFGAEYQKPIPDSPASLKLEVVDSDTIKLEWTKVDGVLYYEIYVSYSKDGKKNDNYVYAGSVVPSAVSDTKLRYYVDGLLPSSWYSVKLKAVNKFGPSSYSSATVYKQTLDNKITATYLDSGKQVDGISQEDDIKVNGVSVVYAIGEKTLQNGGNATINFEQPIYMILNQKYIDMSYLLLNKYPGRQLTVTDKDLKLGLSTDNLKVNELADVDKSKLDDTKIRVELNRALGARADEIKLKLPRDYKTIMSPFAINLTMQVEQDTVKINNFNGYVNLGLKCSELKRALYAGGVYIAYYDKSQKQIVFIDAASTGELSETQVSQTGEYMLVGKLR